MNVLRTCLLLFGLCLYIGHAWGQPVTLEIYNANQPEPAAVCKEAGWNTLVVRTPEDLDLCQSLGLRGVFARLPHTRTGFDADAVREAVEAVRGHPALAGYILIDEPDLRHWDCPPEVIGAMAEVVRAADPDQPTMVTLSGFYGAELASRYAELVDVARMDPYPFLYQRPLVWAIDVVEGVRERVENKPIWLIQQAWSLDETFPDPMQNRCLSYLALIHGVQGISHYAWRFSDRGTSNILREDEPAFWEALVETTGELARLGEIEPVSGTGVRVRASHDQVAWATWKHDDGALLVLCNPYPGSAEVWLGAPGTLRDWRSGEDVAADEHGAYHLVLAPYDTRLFVAQTGETPVPNLEALSWAYAERVSHPRGLLPGEDLPHLVVTPDEENPLHWDAPAVEALHLPQGWKAEGAEASWSVTPPTGHYHRSEGRYDLSIDGQPWSQPLVWSSPLTAGRLDASTRAENLDEADWERAPLQPGAAKYGDLSATLQVLVSEAALHARCVVRDATHLPHLGEGGTWRGDGVQVSLARPFGRRAIPVPGDDGLLNVGLAGDGQNESVLEIGMLSERIDREEAKAAIAHRVLRRGDETHYELAFPWTLLGAGAHQEALAGRLRFALLLNDYPRVEEETGGPALDSRRWLEFGEGIVRGANPFLYADLHVRE